MKIKVLKYKSDGNTLVAPYMDLHPLVENVFISLSEKDKYGYANNDWFYVIFKIENVYFVYEQNNRAKIEEKKYQLSIVEHYSNWIQKVVEAAQQEQYIRLLDIKVFEGLGLDTTLLHKSRNLYLQRKEEREKEYKRKMEEEQKEKALLHEQELDKQKLLFINGAYIKGKSFLEIVKRDGFDIHIRTKGTFNKSVSDLNKNGAILYWRQRGKKAPDISGCQKAIEAYLSFLNDSQTK